MRRGAGSREHTNAKSQLARAAPIAWRPAAIEHRASARVKPRKPRAKWSGRRADTARAAARKTSWLNRSLLDRGGRALAGGVW